MSAEGPVADWPSGVQLREVRSDAGEIAGLVRGWTADRPEELIGLMWYRLPVESDRRNWRWPTLAKVMAGEAPRAAIRAEARPAGSRLVEIDLVNQGTAAERGPDRVTISWPHGRLVASDGLAAYVSTGGRAHGIQFLGSPGRAALAPGERRTLGWLRFDTEVQARVETDAE
jgi:hypothetical protein